MTITQALAEVKDLKAKKNILEKRFFDNLFILPGEKCSDVTQLNLDVIDITGKIVDLQVKINNANTKKIYVDGKNTTIFEVMKSIEILRYAKSLLVKVVETMGEKSNYFFKNSYAESPIKLTCNIPLSTEEYIKHIENYNKKIREAEAILARLNSTTEID